MRREKQETVFMNALFFVTVCIINRNDRMMNKNIVFDAYAYGTIIANPDSYFVRDLGIPVSTPSLIVKN